MILRRVSSLSSSVPFSNAILRSCVVGKASSSCATSVNDNAFDELAGPDILPEPDSSLASLLARDDQTRACTLPVTLQRDALNELASSEAWAGKPVREFRFEPAAAPARSRSSNCARHAWRARLYLEHQA